jgi:hypothetical protein
MLAGLSWHKNAPEKSQVQYPESIPVTYSNYSNDSYGISFSYSNRYFLVEKEVGNAMRGHYHIQLVEDTEFNHKLMRGEIQGAEGPVSISFDIYQNNLDKQSLLSWVKNNNESNYKLIIGDLASTTIAKNEAVAYSYDGLYRGDVIVFAHKDSIVMATVTYSNLSDQIRNDFTSVLSSLTFK